MYKILNKPKVSNLRKNEVFKYGHMALALGAICMTIVTLFIQFAPGKSVTNFDKASFAGEKITKKWVHNV